MLCEGVVVRVMETPCGDAGLGKGPDTQETHKVPAVTGGGEAHEAGKVVD